MSTIFRFLWYSLIAGVIVFYFKNLIIFSPKISLSLQAPRAEVIQVFCDTGEGFNEKQSSHRVLSPSQQKGELFELILPGFCKHLRLDLGGNGSVISILSATLTTIAGYKKDIVENIILSTYLNNIDISTAGQREFVAIGNDPFMVLKGDFYESTSIYYTLGTVLKVIFLFLLLFSIVALLDYWMNKKN